MTDPFAAPPPALSDSGLAALAARHFGVRGRTRALSGERDRNLCIDDGQTRHVLKLANAGEDPAALAMQNAVLRHLAATAPDLPVPRVCTDSLGRDLLWVELDGRRHGLRLLTWLDGQPMAAGRASAMTLRHLGDMLGRLSAALTGFSHPAAERPGFLWNLDNVQACRPFLADMADPADRQRAGTLLDRHAGPMAVQLSGLRRAVLHQDVNDNNVLLDPRGRIAGLIDFGDMLAGRQINELAVALAYGLLRGGPPPAVAAAMVGACHARFPLTAAEARVLPDLVRLRLVQSIAIASHRSRRFPDNPHLQQSLAPARACLARLDGDRAFDAAIVDTVPVNTVPVDTVPVDTVPVDTVPVDTVLSGPDGR